MSSKSGFSIEEIKPSNPGFSRTRAIIETPFYGNNVVKVDTLKEAYNLAKNSPGTVVTDMPVYKAENIGLEKDARVLLFNDGSIVGRYAQARRLAENCSAAYKETLDSIVMDAVYDTRWKKMYHAETVIGMDEEFMVKAHLLVPEGEENILYSWMLNFQYLSEEYVERYKNSTDIGKGEECDIYVFADPGWTGDARTVGVCDSKCLCYFNASENCGAILGMRYFGEYKKGTLTLAWAIAARNGYIPCHGGEKEYTLSDGRKYVAAMFGLSGTGKSTLTHARHNGKYEKVEVLHDDAFIINADSRSSVAMEPTYFDKTGDYKAGCDDNRYLLTVQNCGATADDRGRTVIVTEDVRNKNGRAIKSRLWTPNRVDKIDSPINAVFWIMKDSTLPPLLKISDPVIAATMGLTLTTRRSSAERLNAGVGGKLVIEPYANPFRAYPLAEDYMKFRQLFEDGSTECYIINTGDFMSEDISKELTLSMIEGVVDGNLNMKSFGGLKGMEFCETAGYVPDFGNHDYRLEFEANIRRRIQFIESINKEDGGYDRLPDETTGVLENIICQLERFYDKKVI